MKRMEKRNTRLKYLIVLLLLTAIIFGSSTYAWFTANKSVKVGSIDINVQTVTGIQISTDGINWKAAVSKSDLLGASSTYSACLNQIPSSMEPVSSALGLDGETGRLKMFFGRVTANETTGVYELTATQSVEQGGANKESGYFVAFDIFLKTTADVEDFYISNRSGVRYSGSKTSVGLENATRIAIVKEGNTTVDDSAANIQGLKTTSASNVYLWEPNYLSHTAAGVANARTTYGIETTTNAASNEQLDYAGVAKAISTGVPLGECVAATEPNPETDSFLAVTPNYTTGTTYSNFKIFPLSAGVTKLRVYMWIEGQDVDCENNASGTDIKFDLEFSLQAENT